MACVCWRGLHIKTYISDKTFSRCLAPPPSLFLGILTQKTQVLFTLLKKGAKDNKDSNLTILLFSVSLFCPHEQ